MLAIITGSEAELVSGIAAAGLQIVEKVNTHHPTWYFIYLFLLMGLFAWIRLYYGNIMTQTFQASSNFQASNKVNMVV